MITKTAFLAEYGNRLKAAYAWARDEPRFERYMLSFTNLMYDRGRGSEQANHSGPIVTETWRALGGTGTPTRKALRSLPDGPSV